MNLGQFLTQYQFSLPSILLSIFFGLVIAMGMLMYNKHVPGKLVKYLIVNKIHTPADAVTLEQAGLARVPFLRCSLKDGKILRKTVFCVADEGDDGKSAKYYLPEEKCAKASRAYYKNGASVITVVLALALLFVALSLVSRFAPDLVQMVKNAWPF